MKGEGYKTMSHKFLYNFVSQEEREEKKTQPKSKAIKANVLSITDMTDQAISHRSRNNSSAHSDRSFVDDDNKSSNKYLDCRSKLGNPTSECIKVLLAETFK